MSEPSLPDDPSSWPTDPHQLLGVPRNIGPHDLRRAYTRLIRIYKPEQHPEQFRRIRSAYEAALRVAEFFAEQSEPALEQPATPELLPAPRVFDPANDADALWELAAAGHSARGYAGLVALFGRRPHLPDLPLRLYWLLTLEPNLDIERDPCSWLGEALRLAQLTGPAVELYRRELDVRPAEALAACTNLLSLDFATERLAALAAMRATAAVQTRNWAVLKADLDITRERIRLADESSWLRYLMAAIDSLAWAAGDGAEADALFLACRHELDSLHHLAVHNSELFDRLEFLLAAAGGWTAYRNEADVPPELLELLPRAWIRPFAEIRLLIVRMLERIAGAPHNWLRHLDALESRSPTALSFLGNLLSQYQDRLEQPPPVPHGPADLHRLVSEFLYEEGIHRYRTMRARLLTFCLREAVGAELVAAVAPPANVSGTQLADAIMSDAPLRYVCWACRLYWV